MGAVLLNFDFNKTANAITELTGIPGDVVIDRVYRDYMDSWKGMENGDVEPDSFFSTLISDFQLPLSLAQFKKAYNEIFTLKTDMLELVRQLKSGGYRLGVLSNTSQTHWDYVLETFPELFENFDVLCPSHLARASKPFQRIYQIAAEMAGVKPEEIFFADDLARNIQGARDAGFDAVQFIDRNQIQTELARRGVLV